MINSLEEALHICSNKRFILPKENVSDVFFVGRRNELTDCKWNIKYYNNKIDDIKHKIESAQEDLIVAVERKTKAIQRLEKVKETIKRR